ncbi:MAG: hypothetical protein ACRDRR_02105 [Pseudonocardiaceae bacterium]
MSNEVKAGLALIVIVVVFALFMVANENSLPEQTCTLNAAGVGLVASGLSKGKPAQAIIATAGGVFAVDEACKFAIRSLAEEPQEPVRLRLQTTSDSIDREITASQLTAPPRPLPQGPLDRFVKCYQSYNLQFLREMCYDGSINPVS